MPDQALSSEDAALQVVAHTDGACIGNPGPGGYAAIMRRGMKRRVVRGYELETTNNRMEVTAAIKAIESMKSDAALTIISDSEYVVKGMSEWLPRWKANGWRSCDKKPVKNRDLWERLDALVAARPKGVLFVWTRGHAGDPANEEADAIANAEALKAMRQSPARP